MLAADSYIGEANTWFAQAYPHAGGKTIAYFSAEFGLQFVAADLFGRPGACWPAITPKRPAISACWWPSAFSTPAISANASDHSGWQEAQYVKLDFANVAASPALTPDGREVVVEVELPGRTIYAKVYRIQVGRNPLFLMDTDIHPNSPQDRELSARLYGGDQEMRVAQEIVLGIGGVRALRQMGINPSAWHMNEGHSAFLVLELARELVQKGTPFAEAFKQVQASAVFTTHTPVPVTTPSPCR
ncbi:MAG: hypothetical protein U0Z44_09250 [Kouleothrix sp.]